MTFQLHPLAFGVMLVVAVGTFAYSLWNSRPQRHEYHGHSSRDNPDNCPNFEFYETSSTRSSVPDDERRPSKKKRNSDRCAICLGTKRFSLKTLTCSHSFHEHCIMAWLVENNTCPICRKPTT